jgi:predicted SprT family Zn-dependent metalloprotease
MKLDIAEKLAQSLMDEHVSPHLYGWWTLEWSDSRKHCGTTCFATRTLTLSRYWTRNRSAADVEKTIRHEIAHILTPEYFEDHGPEWAANAMALGIDPDPTSERPWESFKWIATCPGCQKRDGLFRLGPVAARGGYACEECCRVHPTRKTDFTLVYVQQY